MNIFRKIKENPVRSAAQFFGILLLLIVTAAVFLTSVGRPLLNAVYVLILIVAALINLPSLAVSWWIYAIALVGGLAVLNLLSAVLSGVLATVQQELMVKLFGHTADENEGGAVPAFCAKPFDPVEKALNELEMKFETNSVTEEEYIRLKEQIINNGGNN